MPRPQEQQICLRVVLPSFLGSLLFAGIQRVSADSGSKHWLLEWKTESLRGSKQGRPEAEAPKSPMILKPFRKREEPDEPASIDFFYSHPNSSVKCTVNSDNHRAWEAV